MAMRRSAQGFRLAAEPNVIPFIDVLLVLLIIFMATAPKPTVDMRLELANRSGPALAISPTIIDVAPAPGGGARVFIDQREVPLSQLAERTLLRVLSANRALTPQDALAEAHIYVRADQDIAYAHVVAALDALQAAHFAKVGVFAQRADDG